MKYLILSFCLLSINIINSQTKNTSRWYFGNKCGLVFKNNIVYNDTFTNIINHEGTSIIEINDSSFFYSDGRNIYNKKHNIILQGLKSEISSTQGSIMLMHPNNDSIIFMVTNSAIGNTDCKSYYYELLILNDTLLKLKSEKLLNLYGSEKLSAVNHQNGRDIWLISHSYTGNNYMCYLLKNNGLIQCRIDNYIGTNFFNYNGGSVGQIKFSSDGEYIISSSWLQGRLDLFKFNNARGQLYDSVVLGQHSFGSEFSKNTNFAYITNSVTGELIQFDLRNWNFDSIRLSRKIITSKGSKKISSLQLAPNGKIYWSSLDSSYYLAAIEEPDKNGDSCKFNFRSIYLQGKKSTAGLPTFNQSYFHTPAINYTYEMECINNNIQFWGKDTFGSNTHTWQLRKLPITSWQTISSNKNHTYTFADTGRYELRYIATNGTRKDTISKTITMYPKIKNQFLGKDTTYIVGDIINKKLYAPLPNHYVMWQDTSGLSTFTATKKGVYTCKVTNQAFCEVTDTIEIKECLSLAVPSIYKRLTDSIFCTHPLSDTFVWYRNNVPYKTAYTNGGDISSLKLTDTGTYRVEAVKYGHCNRTSSTFNINKLGIKGIRIEDLGIRVFPNPSSGVVNVESDINYKLKITDLIGRTILETENTKQVILVKGVYFLRFEIEGYFVIQKVVVL